MKTYNLVMENKKQLNFGFVPKLALNSNFRHLCLIKGCERFQHNKGKNWGESPFCKVHHCLSRDELNKIYPMGKCSMCGWDGPCDIHRLIPGEIGGKYHPLNVKIICPNCHRLQAMDKQRRVRKWYENVA